jgi:rhodanese-related sulfurtransferase
MVLAAACGTAPAAQDAAVIAPLPAEISVDQAYKMYQQGTFLLDVRTPEEWEAYHLEGTTLIPLDELESRVDELPVDEEIVVVCRSGNRSQVGRDILRQAGITQSTSMAGGLKGWYAAGYPLVGSP